MPLQLLPRSSDNTAAHKVDLLPVVRLSRSEMAKIKARRTRWGKSRVKCLARRSAQPFPVLARNSPREVVSIKSNMFDIFGLARQIPRCVRPSWESSWAWSIKHPIKIHSILTWLQWRRKFFLRHHLEPLESREYAMYFYWMFDQTTELSSILTMAAHSEESTSWGQKYKTCLILSSRPREAPFPPQFPRTREETAEQTASRGSLLSSFLKCAAGLTERYLFFVVVVEIWPSWNETVCNTMRLWTTYPFDPFSRILSSALSSASEILSTENIKQPTGVWVNGVQNDL